MTDVNSPQRPVQRITVRVRIGEHILSASDDPLFLGFRGPCGREFRLAFKHGKSLRRGKEDLYVFGAPDDPETNVDHAELNDPTTPVLDAASIQSVFLRKGFEPIPNVRALGEMDDRLEVLGAEIDVYVVGEAEPQRYERPGPVWLGLVCGLSFEVPRTAAGS